jgi:hypothetical protein
MILSVVTILLSFRRSEVNYHSALLQFPATAGGRKDHALSSNRVRNFFPPYFPLRRMAGVRHYTLERVNVFIPARFFSARSF